MTGIFSSSGSPFWLPSMAATGAVPISGRCSASSSWVYFLSGWNSSQVTITGSFLQWLNPGSLIHLDSLTHIGSPQKKINHFLQSGTGPITCEKLKEMGYDCPKMKGGSCKCKAPAALRMPDACGINPSAGKTAA